MYHDNCAVLLCAKLYSDLKVNKNNSGPLIIDFICEYSITNHKWDRPWQVQDLPCRCSGPLDSILATWPYVRLRNCLVLPEIVIKYNCYLILANVDLIYIFASCHVWLHYNFISCIDIFVWTVSCSIFIILQLFPGVEQFFFSWCLEEYWLWIPITTFWKVCFPYLVLNMPNWDN